MEKINETIEVAISELLMKFIQTVNYDYVDRNPNVIMPSSLRHSILANSSPSTSAYVDLKKSIDDEYGLVVQFLDSDDNSIFYSLEEINGEKKYTKLDQETTRILEDKYFRMESDLDD